MPLYLPNGDIVAPEYADLDRKLKYGDGIHWTGDQRLYIQIGVLTNRVTGKQGRRIEVWRLNEDGSDTRIAYWLPSEQHRIIFDIARMRADAPGHVNVLDEIDRHNKARDEELATAARESMFNTLDHAIRLHHERSGAPRQRFFMGGRADRGGRA